MRSAARDEQRQKFSEMPKPTEQEGGKFDLRTHFFNSAGQNIGANPYRYYNGPDYGDVFERPVGSGNCFTMGGEPAGGYAKKEIEVDGKKVKVDDKSKPLGRMLVDYNEKGVIVSKKWDKNAEHIEYKAPLKGAEKLVADLSAAQERNKALEAELAAIKGDKKPSKEAPAAPSLKG